MDRLEAYNLLINEMKKLKGFRPDQLSALCGSPIEIDCPGTRGTLYHVELRVERKTGVRS